MSQLNTIPEAIEAIQRGEIIIVVDDEDRENEGDFLLPARHATPEVINFMATHGRGLICAPLLESRCDELGLELMVESNSAAYETPFTVSVDLIGHGCTTGISASDRSKTIKALIDPNTRPEELGKPGHIFPLRAKPGGVLRRPGHTEAAVDFSRLAGFEPAGVIVEIMNEDGTMARLPQLLELAAKHSMKLVSIADLIAYRLEHESLIERTAEVDLNTEFGPFKAISFRQTTNDVDHLALVKGEWNVEEAVPVRVHASSMVADIFQVSDFGKGPQLHSAMRQIQNAGKGAVVFLNKTRHGGGLADELHAYALMKQAKQSGVFPKLDSKDRGIGAQILRNLGIHRISLLSNSAQTVGDAGYGLTVVEVVPIA
ncbi:MAG: 3,4-dihydroxy-2-butanone-4-phosphate synthase [Flavobacteriales bacterium]